MNLSHQQLLDCLLRQVPNDENLSCENCPLANPMTGYCGIVGESDQYLYYMDLLRDPAVPPDLASPLLSALDHCSNMDNEYCDLSCPYYDSCLGEDPSEVFRAVWQLCRDSGLYQENRA